MNSITINSDKDLFFYKKEDKMVNLNNFIIDEGDSDYYPFLPREKKSHYVIKRLTNGKYILYEGYDYSKSFGLEYDSITPISGGNIVNSDKCYALKVERDNRTYFISPIDLMQTPLENEVQSIIMSSFISDSYKIFSKAVSEVEFSDMVAKDKFLKAFNRLEKNNPYSLNKIANPPVSTAIDTLRYDPKICEILAGRFYTLVESYKKSIIENNSLSKKAKEKLFKDFFPRWEENTLKKLFEISQQSNLNNISKVSNRINDKKELLAKVKKATITIKKEMSDDESKEIRELLTENTIDNGGTLEYATLTRDVYVKVESEGEILGYVGLVSHGDGRLYVGVTAVKKEYQGLGIGSIMYDFIKQHSSQFSILTADVRNFNIASKRLHFKQGFKIVDSYGGILDPNEMVYNDNYNLGLAFDLTTIKNRKPLTIGTSMKMSDLYKEEQINEVEFDR